MADKIPIYGELDCRTEENIIADATQIRYDATKTVKEKIADLETGGTGEVDEITFNNATYDLLQAVCGIADDEVTDVIKLQIDATKKQTLFVSSLTNDAQCAFGLANDNGTILKPTSNFIGNFPMALKCPFVITSYQSAYSSKWIVRYFDSNINGYTTERVEIVSSAATKLPITLGISVTNAGGNVYNWTKDIANKLSYKIVTPKYSDARPMPKFEIRNISSGNTAVIDQYTVCEKYDDTYYRATHYFKLRATANVNKIILTGELVLTNGATSVHTYVQSLFGFATFAGTDASSLANNDQALSVATTLLSTPSSWADDTHIARIRVASNSIWNSVGDMAHVMVVVLFKPTNA